MAPDSRVRWAALRTRAHLRARAGLTLLELMVVVAILAILAGIATPLYMRYLYRSKATEAVVVLAEIQSRQEAWRSLPEKRYCDVSANAQSWFPSPNPGGSQQSWPIDPEWSQLFGRPYPKGYRATYFSYVVVAGAPGTAPDDRAFSDDRGITGNDSWYIARALGDLNGDETLADSPKNITFEFTSESRHIWVSNSDGWQ